MLFLLIPSLIWALSYGLIKTYLASSLSPDFIAWVRMFLPLLLFLPFLRVSSLSYINRLQWIGIGVIQYGLMYILLTRSYAYLPAYQIVLFAACTPIYVTLISNLFSRSFTPVYLCTAALSFVGVLCLFINKLGNTDSLQGFLLVQIADICFAFGQVAYRKLRPSISHLKDKNIYALLFLGATAITTLSTSYFHGWDSLFLLSSTQIYILIYLGFIASGISFFLWSIGTMRTNVGTFAVLNNLKTPLGVLCSLLIFGEQANWVSLGFSGAIIGIAVFLSEKQAKKRSVAVS